VQPPGQQPNGERFPAHNEDIRDMEGEGIPPMTEKELEESVEKHPSPACDELPVCLR
jgi:hypothetical protein